MSDLAAFLRARLDEDEATARDIQRSRDDLFEPGQWVDDPWKLTTCPDRFDVHVEPGRVLREVGAKRRIIDEHSRDTRPHATYPEVADQCISCGYGDSWEAQEYGPTYPCATLRFLAAVWADHPDYQPEWRLLPDTP